MKSLIHSKKGISLVLFFAIFTMLLLNSTIFISVSALQLNSNDNNNFSLFSVNASRPNIIIMIGDGMGPEYVKMASLVEYGVPNGTIMDEEFPYQTLYNTTNIKGQITDSAAAGTAIATGFKTVNKFVSLSPDKNKLKTILEYLVHDYNYSSGLVTTTSIPHATPAVFASHVESRYMEAEIWKQEMTQGIDVLMGGYSSLMFSKSKQGLIDEVKNTYGYPVATNKAEMFNLSTTKDRFVGLFGEKYLPYEIERNTNTTPSIVEMTQAALNLLTSKNNPFFLMVEGGRIDHAGHDKNLTNAIIETIMFEKSVRLVKQIAEKIGNTIVIVIADHETCGLKLLSPPTFENNTLPSHGFTRQQNMTIRLERISQLNASFTAPYHTDWPVRFYGYGPGLQDSVSKIHHLKDIFWVLNDALGDFPTITLDKDFNVHNQSLSFNAYIKDQDKSVNKMEVIIKYNDSTQIFEKPFVFNASDSLGLSINVNVTVKEKRDFNFYVKLVDNNSPFNTTSLKLFYHYVAPSTNPNMSNTTQNSTATTSVNPSSQFSFLSFPMIYLSSGTLIISAIIIKKKSKRKE